MTDHPNIKAGADLLCDLQELYVLGQQELIGAPHAWDAVYELLPEIIAALEERDRLREENLWLRAQTECPACGCSTPDDADGNECGCDAPVCAIEAPYTLGDAYHVAKGEIKILREALAGREQSE